MSSYLLIAVCGVLGFGIVWSMIPAKSDKVDPDSRQNDDDSTHG
jgi:hypothetical protein